MVDLAQAASSIPDLEEEDREAKELLLKLREYSKVRTTVSG